MTGQVATADVDISASPGQVWTALTDPKLISKYMFGAKVETSWEVGSPIRWKGEYDRKSYEDKGEVVAVTYERTEQGERTHLKLEQDNNPTDEAAEKSQKNWETVLNGIKEVVERG